MRVRRFRRHTSIRVRGTAQTTFEPTRYLRNCVREPKKLIRYSSVDCTSYHRGRLFVTPCQPILRCSTTGLTHSASSTVYPRLREFRRISPRSYSPSEHVVRALRIVLAHNNASMPVASITCTSPESCSMPDNRTRSHQSSNFNSCTRVQAMKTSWN